MFKNVLSEYIYQNKKIITSLFACIIIGIVSGISIYLLSGSSIKEVLTSQMREAINLSDNGQYIKTEIIYNGIRNNLIYIATMGVFSIMLYGSIFIYFWHIVKGMSIGIYIATLFSIFGPWWGMVSVLILVILVNVVYLPASIFAATTLINYNINVMEYRCEAGKVVNITSVLLKLSFAMLIIFSSIIVEQLMSNIAIQIIKIV